MFWGPMQFSSIITDVYFMLSFSEDQLLEAFFRRLDQFATSGHRCLKHSIQMGLIWQRGLYPTAAQLLSFLTIFSDVHIWRFLFDDGEMLFLGKEHKTEDAHL